MPLTLMEGKSHKPKPEAETVSMIRTVIEDDGPQGKAGPKGRTKSKAHLFVPLKGDAPESPPEPSTGRRSLTAVARVALSALRRIKRKHVVLGAVALLAYVRPLWVLSAVVLVVIGIAALFFLAGPDKFWRGVVLGLDRVAEKDPVRGIQLRSRLDAFAMWWDRILDRFPDGSVDGLYMPDLQELGDKNRDQAERLEARLKRLKQEASAELP